MTATVNATYEVLSPWAEVDPIALRGISPRLSDMRGKRIGLFHNNKVAGRPILDAVEAELRGRFEGVEVARYGRTKHEDLAHTGDTEAYERWVRDVDAVVLAVGD